MSNNNLKTSISKAYRVEVSPNKVQSVLLLMFCGVARWAYNWGIRYMEDLYNTCNKSVSSIELHKEVVRLKHEMSDIYGWLKAIDINGVSHAVSKCCAQEALRNLERAWTSYFKDVKSGRRHYGKPVYKKKKYGRGSFRLTGTIKIDDDRIQLPNLGKLKLKERNYLPVDLTGIKINSVTVVQDAGRWYVSVNVKEDVYVPPIDVNGDIVGLDVGIKTLVTTSDGIKFPNLKVARKASTKIRRAHREFSRKKSYGVDGGKGKNRDKAQLRLQKVYKRTRNQRSDVLHKSTSVLAKAKSVRSYVIEDLNVVGMMKNHKLAGSLSDVSFGEFFRMLKYKCEWNGIGVITANRWFPSSKLCSSCGEKKTDLRLSEREYVCFNCGNIMDRDENAAINLRKYGERELVLV